jgi:hypothetical protein
VIGTEALLQQHHRFRKTEPNARLEFEITGLTLEAIDDNAFLPTHGECPWLAPGDHDPQECATVMYASVDFTVEALGPTEGDHLQLGARRRMFLLRGRKRRPRGVARDVGPRRVGTVQRDGPGVARG